MEASTPATASAPPAAPAQPCAVVGAYRSNSGDQDVLATKRALARRSDAASMPATRGSGGPLFTGSSGARADALAVRLSDERGLAPVLSPAAAATPADGCGYFGSSAAAFERRAARYRDFCDAAGLGGNGGAPVFSGADSRAHERRMLRCVDRR